VTEVAILTGVFLGMNAWNGKQHFRTCEALPALSAAALNNELNGFERPGSTGGGCLQEAQQACPLRCHAWGVGTVAPTQGPALSRQRAC